MEGRGRLNWRPGGSVGQWLHHRIRIRVEVKSWIWIRIRIEVKSWIRIRIRNEVKKAGSGSRFALKWKQLEPDPNSHWSEKSWNRIQIRIEMKKAGSRSEFALKWKLDPDPSETLDPDPHLNDADPEPWTWELVMISTCDCEDGLDALPAHGVVHHAEVLPAVLHQRLPDDQGPAHLKPRQVRFLTVFA